MRQVSQSFPAHQPLSRHLVQSEGDETPGPAPQETSRSKGDKHGTYRRLIWTTRTQHFRGIYGG